MTKLITSAVATLLMLSGLGSNAFAQDRKKTISLEPVIVSGDAYVIVKENVINAFKLTHQGALHTRWFKVDENYLVKFILNNEPNRAVYTEKGDQVYEISYGNKNDLPVAAKEEIENNYAGYDITSAIHLKQSDKDVWFVTVDNPKEFMVVNIQDGLMIAGNAIKKSF